MLESNYGIMAYLRKGRDVWMKYCKIKSAVLVCLLCLLGTGISTRAAVLPERAYYAKDGLEYYILDGQRTAAVKIKNKNVKIKIPETVDIQGKSYQVTEIKSAAIAHDTVVVSKKEKVARDDKEYFKNTKAKTVWIPKTVTKIETGAFSYFTNLKKIIIDKDNPSYVSSRKGVFSKDGKTLVLAFNGTGTYKVRNGVEKIADRAFAGTEYKRVILPDSCYKVGTRAFFKCRKLKKIKGGSLCVCGKYAFFGTKVKGADSYGTMRFKI